MREGVECPPLIGKHRNCVAERMKVAGQMKSLVTNNREIPSGTSKTKKTRRVYRTRVRVSTQIIVSSNWMDMGKRLERHKNYFHCRNPVIIDKYRYHFWERVKEICN